MYYKSTFAQSNTMSKTQYNTGKVSPMLASASSLTNFASFPKRRNNLNFAMRPQSGVPLSSKKVVPKNLERNMYEAALNKMPAGSLPRSKRISSAAQRRATAESPADMHDQATSLKQTCIKKHSTMVTRDSKEAASTTMGSVKGGPPSLMDPRHSYSSTFRIKEPPISSMSTTKHDSESAFSLKKSASVFEKT